MRLLNTRTFEVKEFFTDTPAFAILSHTWEKDEVTFQDIHNLEIAKKKAGWSKVQNACEYVQRYKFEWVWIDTCCIDKSSSAELSEALNSMYQYYGNGQVCIAYLSDVSTVKDVQDLEEFKISRWFKRGWTLQELIAPRYMVFLDKNWNMIGTRFSMRNVISEVTSIPVKVFSVGQIGGYSIAQKMSWVASRETTRPEDMAYCLMGLFGVNMPPIYGEGGVKAFMRLQQEIIKYSDDRSIFAWVASQDYHRERGLFASSPLEFASSRNIGVSKSGNKSAFSFNNNGLHIHLPLQRLPDLGENIFLASLHCRTADGYIGIYLQQRKHGYVRMCPHFPLPSIDNPESGQLQEVVVKESPIPRRRWDKDEDYDIPIEFKLDDAQITLLDEVDNKDNENPRNVQLLSLRRDSARYFRLRTKKGVEFNLELSTSPNDIIPVLQVRVFIHNRVRPHVIHDLQDSLSCFEDGNALPVGLICFVHVTGGVARTRIVELNCISTSSAQFMLYRQIDGFKSSPRALSSTTINFVADAEHTFPLVWTHSVFPLSLLCSWDGRRMYGTLSGSGEQHDIHCVLACDYNTMNNDTKFVFIVLGRHTGRYSDIPWIDVIVSSDKIPISGIWESYLPSGSMYGRKNKRNAIASLDSSLSLNLTVSRKKISGAVWYHVKMEPKIMRAQLLEVESKREVASKSEAEPEREGELKREEESKREGELKREGESKREAEPKKGRFPLWRNGIWS